MTVRYPQEIENPRLLHTNKLPQRAYFTSGGTVSLDGEWDFRYYDAPGCVPDNFMDICWEGADKIPVPSCWQLHGYGQMQYTDVLYPIPVTPPLTPDLNPTGVYHRTFTCHIPSGHECALRFYGVDSAFDVWVNGAFAGFAKISRNISEFDITEFAVPGENHLTVRVFQWSDGSYLECQDMWWLSGIFRPVEMEIRPKDRVRDFSVRTDINGDLSQAEICVTIDAPRPEGVRASFLDADGRHIADGLRFLLDNPRCWSAEEPYLYTLKIFYGEQEITQKVGIRSVNVKGSQFFVNGKAVMLNGVNRHDVSPENGRTVSVDEMRWDVLEMKRHNINAVRSSHYPNMPLFYDLCDEFGLYVICEADLECHGFQPVGRYDWITSSTEWTEQYIARGTEMVQTHKNHPSIIMWSLGNESVMGSNFYQMAQAIRSLDGTRLIHYEGDRADSVGDICSRMYTRLEKLKLLGQYEEGKPLILCEYAHAMGNGPGGLKEYQEAFRQYKRLQGGFVWEWICHGIRRTDSEGKTYFAYGGDYGEFPHNGNFCLDGLVFPDRAPSPGLAEYKKIIEPVTIRDAGDGLYKIENRYDFLSTGHLTLRWSLLADGLEQSSGFIPMENIPPGGEGSFNLPEPALDKEADYRVHFYVALKEDASWAKAGHVVATADFPLTDKSPKAALPCVCSHSPHFEDKGVLLSVVTLAGINYMFNQITGRMEQATAQGQEVIKKGPTLNFWRPPIDNDMYEVDGYKNKYYLHKYVSKLISMDYRAVEGKAVVETVQYIVPVTQSAGWKAVITYVITGDGVLDIQVNGERVNAHLNPPEMLPKIGMEMELPEALTKVAWYGKGPGQSYPDSCQAPLVGRYETDADAMFVNYPVPQENGNRSETRWVSLRGGNLSLLAEAAPGETFNFSVSRYTKEAVEEAKHQNELKPSGFLTLNLDYRQNGLGSASCGEGILPAYKLAYEDFKFGFTLTPGKGMFV
jgi:beta-galactosidase/evolved beta-galactosidase subunit alpha